MLLIVMISALQNVQPVFFDLIDQPMFVCYSSAPATGKIPF